MSQNFSFKRRADPARPRIKRRPYNPVIDPMLARWAAQRQQTLRQTARELGIPPQLLREWLSLHPELAAALNAGRQAATAQLRAFEFVALPALSNVEGVASSR